MRVSLECRDDVVLPVGGGAARLSASGSLVVTTPAGVILRAQVSDDPDDSDVELWVRPDWLVAVAARGHTVVSCDLEAGSVVSLPGLARLDLPGYDPGGLHRVQFFDVRHERRVLVETEVALLCVEPASIVWQNLHGDVTCRVRAVEPARALMVCEQDSRWIRLRDGREVLE